MKLSSLTENKSLRIWVFQSGEPLHQDKSGMRAMRAMNLTDELVLRGHHVTLWSSRFDHFTHTHRMEKSRKVSSQLEIKLVNSTGYRRNLGIGRIVDHAILALNLKRELSKCKPPDVAFIGYPPIETAWVMKSWLNKNNVQYLVDVKDMWPDIFLTAIPIKLQRFVKLLLEPYFRMMRSTLTNAKSICSISEPFLGWAQNQTLVSRDRSFDTVAHLTSSFSDMSEEDEINCHNWLDKKVPKYRASILISFVGSVTPTFDFSTIFKVARERQDLKFVIAGAGSKYEDLQKVSEGISNIIWLGWISAVQANYLINQSLACVAPYRDDMAHGFEFSIPNKVFDIMQSGKPILLSGSEYMKTFVDSNEIGITYPSNEPSKLVEAIDELLKSKNVVNKFGKRAKELYDGDFSAKIVYANLCKLIEKVAHSNLN